MPTVHTTTLPDGHVVSDERARLDMDLVHAGLAEAYWARGRSRAVTDRSWAHCHAFGVYAPGGALAGFGRVLTDYALRAHVADVMVVPASRGRGLGRALVGAMLDHPELAGVPIWTLTTADAQGLYGRFGFRVADADPMWMVLDRRPGRPG